MYGRARLVRRVQRRFGKTIMRCWRRVIWVRRVRRVSLTLLTQVEPRIRRRVSSQE